MVDSTPYDEHERRYKNAALVDTWGHLAPAPDKIFNGFLIWTYGEWGHISPVKQCFIGLEDSPWFFDALNEFICKKSKKQGSIYRFDGSVKMCKNGVFKFSGKTKVVVIDK